MLQALYIKNYAIIDEVTLDFEGGFNVITGETGAGKSILLGALRLINGHRADTKVLYDQSAKCIVEATFTLSKELIDKIVAEVDVDFDDQQLIIRREISSTGKSRAFVNDTPVKLMDIKFISKNILDIHNQFDTLTITDPVYQLEVIDTIAENQKPYATYRKDYQLLLQLRSEVKKLETAKHQNQQDLDFVLYQLKELDEIPLDGIIKQELIDEHATLSNAEEIIQVVQGMTQEFQESDHAVSSRITEYLRKVSDLSQYNPQLSEIEERLEEIVDSLREVDTISTRLADRIDISDERLKELTDTIDHINQLEQKHKANSIAQLIEIRDNYRLRTEGVVNIDEALEKKREALAKQEIAIATSAKKLTTSRTKVFDRICKVLRTSLANLAIPNAQLQLQCTETAEYQESGKDEISLLFSANKGIDPQPIQEVASGGELSRVALSVKSLIAEQYGVPTLIFDEIDTGISGAVAKRVGEILEHIADARQVICITHSPQVAAIASKHFLVAKRDTKTRTITNVRELDLEGRIDEIGKMLSEDPPSGSALVNARELLGLT